MEILKLLFWIATLYGCLQAHPIKGCKKGSLKVKEMRNLTCEQDSTFYTPQDVKAECLTAALDCVMTELKTAKEECNDPHEYIDQGIAYLNRTIINRPDKNHVLDSNDCPCEGWPTTDYTTFLNKLEALCEFEATLEQSASAHRG